MTTVQPLLHGEDLRKGMIVRIARASIEAPPSDMWAEILSVPEILHRVEMVETEKPGPSEPKFEQLRCRYVQFVMMFEDGIVATPIYPIGTLWEFKL